MSDVVAAPAEAVAPSNAPAEAPAAKVPEPVDHIAGLEAALKAAGGLKFSEGFC